MNFSAITHRAVFVRTNDANLRCKQESLRRLRDLSRINIKSLQTHQTQGTEAGGSTHTFPSTMCRGNLRALRIDIFTDKQIFKSEEFRGEVE